MQSTLVQKRLYFRFALTIEVIALELTRGLVELVIAEPEAHEIPFGKNRGPAVRVGVVEHLAELSHRIFRAIHALQPSLGDEHPGLAPYDTCGKRLRRARECLDLGGVVRERRISPDALKAG